MESKDKLPGSVEGREYDNKIRKMTVGGILFLLSFLLLYCAKRITGAADWYSEHIYPLLTASLGRISGMLPFSAAEICLYLLTLYIVLSFIFALWGSASAKLSGRAGHAARLMEGASVGKVRRGRNEQSKGGLTGWLVNLFFIASILFLLYVINCGINYNRNSFSDRVHLQTEQYTAEELTEVCRQLAMEVNRTAPRVKRDSDGVMVLGGDEKGGAVKAMERLGKVYTDLGGYYPEPKGLINPWILSVQSLTGVYAPFTIEANYNNAVTDYYIPFTMCHELSHLKGFMQEEEANFIGWLACSLSERPDFQYSAGLMGWTYCMDVLYKTDYEAYRAVRRELNPQSEKDLKANREFWARYEGKIAEVSSKVNDSYLKANGQEEGVQSYDRMVDLLVAYVLRDNQH